MRFREKKVREPDFIVVEVTGKMGLHHTVSLMDAVLLASLDLKSEHPVNVIFLMGPVSSWNWFTHPDLTRGLKACVSTIHLARWSKIAIESELEKVGLSNTPGDRDRILAATDGWHAGIQALIAAKNEAPEVANTLVRKFEWAGNSRKSQYRLLTEIGLSKEVQPWMGDLIASLAEMEGFTLDDVGYHLLEVVAGIDTDDGYENVLQWLAAMGALDLVPTENVPYRGKPERKWRLAASIRHTIRSAVKA